MIALDFFCGGGGLTRGFLNAGVKVIAGIDHNDSFKYTYEFNNHPTKFIHADVNKLQPQTVRNIVENINPEELIFSACAPCQPFASLNKYGRNDDAKLLGRFAVFIKAVQPKYIFIENVIGLAKVKGYSTFERFKDSLEKMNYFYSEEVIDAKIYGVPQNRRRLILVAIRGEIPKMPPATHGPGLLPYVSVGDVFKILSRNKCRGRRFRDSKS